jgi:hypothetical protein
MKFVFFHELKLVIESVGIDGGLFYVTLDPENSAKYNLHFYRDACLKTLFREKRYTLKTQRGEVKSYSSLDTLCSDVIKMGGFRFTVDLSEEIK